MNFKGNLSIIILVLLSSCTPFAAGWKTIADASAEIKHGQMLPITAVAQIAGHQIKLEVAETPDQQATGLMFRESLASDRGMLFLFKEKRVARFWMKNVPISLDMIFIDGSRIVGIASNVPPCKAESCPVYGPETNSSQLILVDKVIELRGGTAKELGLKINDTINLKLLKSPAEI